MVELQKQEGFSLGKKTERIENEDCGSGESELYRLLTVHCTLYTQSLTITSAHPTPTTNPTTTLQPPQLPTPQPPPHSFSGIVG